jgi:hypothetical protein
MPRTVSYLAAGLCVPAGLIAGFLTLYADAGLTADGALTRVETARPPSRIERRRKSDRLPLAATAIPVRPQIASVEVMGRRGVIVYRDRAGRILFETNPGRATTIVAKAVAIPETTLRTAKDAAPEPKPEALRAPSSDSKKPTPPRLLPGCDPMFSPMSDPALARLPGRCLAAKDPSTTLVALPF